MQRDLRALVDGIVGGCLGTIAMSIVMVAAQKVGMLGGQPPAHIAGAGLDALGLRRTRKEQGALAVVLHLVFGSTAGALFGLLSRRLHGPLGPAAAGRYLRQPGLGNQLQGLDSRAWDPTAART